MLHIQEGLDVGVERAACSLLLGDAQHAVQLLGLAASQQQSSSHDAVKEFVLVSNCRRAQHGWQTAPCK